MKIEFTEDRNNFKKGQVIEVANYDEEKDCYVTYDYNFIYNVAIKEVDNSTPTTIEARYLDPQCPIKTSVKPKGGKYLIEVELTRDAILEASCLYRSLFSKCEEQSIEGTFKVNVIYPTTLTTIIENLKETVIRAIDRFNS